MSLAGRVALVTGASRGIGRATALRLAREGAAVCVNYRREADAAARAIEEIAAAGGRAVAVGADVGDPAAVRSMTERVERELGPVDILVNNAGVLSRGDLADFDFSLMEPMRRVNVDGLVAVTRAVVGGMKTRRWGRIVNLSSLAALGTSLPGTTFYAATKAAVITLTRRFALELGPFGITVNAVAPGFIATDMVGAGRSPDEVERLMETMAGRAMMRRVGRPEDIANAIAFLVSEESSFVTAQVLTVDGGRTDYISHP
jgi:NAD(P)-dependent dehydrogenase (short-subunit alcohol dehydrogenase family)